MRKQDIYNLISLVGSLRRYQLKNRDTLSKISMPEQFQLLEIKSKLPLIQNIDFTDEYFEKQNLFLRLIKSYVLHRLLVTEYPDNSDLHQEIIRLETRIDKGLKYISSNYPTVYTPNFSTQIFITLS